MMPRDALDIGPESRRAALIQQMQEAKQIWDEYSPQAVLGPDMQPPPEQAPAAPIVRAVAKRKASAKRQAPREVSNLDMLMVQQRERNAARSDVMMNLINRVVPFPANTIAHVEDPEVGGVLHSRYLGPEFLAAAQQYMPQGAVPGPLELSNLTPEEDQELSRLYSAYKAQHEISGRDAYVEEQRRNARKGR